MENLNAEQIKKALECCAYGLCRDCALYSDDGCGNKVIIGAIELINSQEQKIFELENRLKECENGYEGTLHLESCKLHDAEEKVKELTQAHEMLSESYDHLEKTKDELLSERSRLTEENERLRGILLQFTDIVHKWGNKNGYDTSEISLVPILNEETAIKSQIRADTVRQMQSEIKERCIKGGIYPAFVASTIDQIAKEMLEGEK